MNAIRKIIKGIQTFLSWMNGVASFSIALIMVLITLDVLSRLVLNKPFVGTAEIVSSIIIIVCFLEIPYVAVKGAHVRTTVLYDAVGKKGKLVINSIAAILGILVYAFIIKASFPGFLNAIKIHEAEIAGSFRITTVPGRTAILFGSSLMILEFICQLFLFGYELATGKNLMDEGAAS
ncbi:MAG: TRAP transporter small permease [Spirochaetaceae bacterium]|nr:TRAP transporter small permease [Spirochaetaceae bacterium]